MNITSTRMHVEKILAYLTPSLGFINCHMVEFITGNLWEKYIPQDIRDEIRKDGDIQSGVKLFFGSGDPKAFPNLHTFITNAENYRLEAIEGVLTSQESLFDAIGIDKDQNYDSVNIREFMNEKKNHEVDIASKLVAALVSHVKKEASHGEVYILDAGDGKGYLSSRLALQYNLKVLGIDASEVNTEGAQKRMKKLERAWEGLKQRTAMINNGLTPPPRSKKPKRKEDHNDSLAPKTSPTYKCINNFITKETDFDQLITTNFEVATDFSTCLTGLHTCGNLSPTCLETFAHNPRIKLMCNVGCCYHLLSETYTDNDNFNAEIIKKSNIDGFPLSMFLKEKKVKLGRNARMLASQSIHRTQMKNELNTQSLYYRAVLEVILQEKYPDLTETPRVGKLKNFTNFKEYLQRCEAKCQLKLDQLEDIYVDTILKKHAEMEDVISLYYLIRMSYAQVVETLILLDRLLFLQENGIDKSYLIRLFDPVKSPRCYGIVAIR